MTEAQIHSAVMSHWKALGIPGTLVATIPNMRAAGQAGLTKGLPDLMVMGGPYLRDRVGFIELKTENGKLRIEQTDFKHFFAATGIPYAVTYGRDQPIRVLEEWGVVRSRFVSPSPASERAA